MSKLHQTLQGALDPPGTFWIGLLLFIWLLGSADLLRHSPSIAVCMIDIDTGKLLQLSWAGQREERKFLRESVTRSCGHSRDGNTLYIFSFPHVPSI